MRSIMGINYLTDKEASLRYGYSQSWFIQARMRNTGPKYIQFTKKGRVLYPLEATDKWFEDRMRERE